jgi:hypothetical protein
MCSYLAPGACYRRKGELQLEKLEGDPRHEQEQGPASMKTEGPSAGHTLKELGQPIHSQNAAETMPRERPKTK